MQSNIPDPRIHSSLGASPPGSSADGSAQQPKPCAEQDLRTILNSLREAIFTIDGQDRIWMFNPAASRVFGIPEEELFGLPVARLHVDEEAALRFKANHMATLHRDGTAEDEIPMRRGDGEIFAAETTLVLLGDLSGVKNGYILVVRDINHRKRNQEQVMRRTRQMAVLNEIGSLLNRSLERDDVLPLTLEKLRQRLQCERVNFFAVKGSREPGEMILFQGAPGNTATAAAATLPETPSRTGPVWRAASTRQVVLVEDFPGDSAPGDPDRKWHHTGSTACIPILTHGKLLGVLTLSREKQQPFSGEDVDLFLPLAQMMATVVENIRLIAGLKNLNEQLLSLHELSVRLAQNNSEKRILSETLETLSQILGSRIAVYREPDVNRKELVACSCFGLDALSSSAGAMFPPPVPLEGCPIPPPAAAAFLSCTLNPESTSLDCLPGSPWRKHLQASGIRSLIAAPVLVQRKPLGVATFYSEDRSGLTSNDSRLLQVALRQAGAAMANARLFADLQTHRRILGRLSSRILTAQEEERQHLSRELHDGIGQSLSALKLGLEMLSGDHPERRSRSLQEDLSQALEIVTETIAELRRISQDLRPPILDDLGLLPTLRWLANRFQVQTGLEVQIEVEGEERTLTPQQDVNLYRIAQESLANVSRHAHATSVRIHVLWDSTTVQLRITDNGAGFQPGAGDGGPPGGGLGMASIKERANLMGGRFRVKSRPHKGTTLEVEIPFHSHTGEHPKSVAGT